MCCPTEKCILEKGGPCIENSGKRGKLPGSHPGSDAEKWTGALDRRCALQDRKSTRLNSTALGVDAETAAEDACRIEHVLSEETFDKLKQHAKAYIDAQGK